MADKRFGGKEEPVHYGIHHIPEHEAHAKKEHLEDAPEFEHLFLDGHVRSEVIQRFKVQPEPNPSYVRLPQPAPHVDLSGPEVVAVRGHFLKCKECRNARDGNTLF